MRYHIDTIPVWDAVKEDTECFLCALRNKIELQEIDRYLGGSVMEPDTRQRVNKLGFCQKHHKMLYAQSNRLGHALMLETNLMETRSATEKAAGEIAKAANRMTQLKLTDKLTAKGKDAKETYLAAVSALTKLSCTCALCDSLQENVDRYVYTFFHLWKTDKGFQDALMRSKGFCLPDAALLLEKAAEALPAKELSPFVEAMLPLVRQHLDRTQEDITWFIRKFDYRFKNEPWKDSRDAVERTANKLRGKCCP